MINVRRELLGDAKAFHALRIINVFFSHAHPRDFSEKDKFQNAFLDLCKTQEFRHHIDTIYNIEHCFEIGSLSLQRSFGARQWSELDFKKPCLSHPLLLLFCSAFNEAMDTALRNAFGDSDQVNDYSVLLEATSFYLYDKIIYNLRAKTPTDPTGYWDAIVLFQVSDGDLVRSITNPSGFFANPFLQMTSITENLAAVKYGLLRGQFEGFILLRCNVPTKEAAQQMLQREFEDGSGWLSKIKPITVFLCKPLRQKIWGANNRFMAEMFAPLDP